MRLLSRLEVKQKSGAIRYLFFRHSPYLNTFDSAQAVQRLVAFYVTEHNCHTPHSAFRGETPDEMYYGRGAEITEQLSMARKQARMHRINTNQAQTCLLCQADAGNKVLAPMMA